MSRYLYKKIQNISPESLNFQHSGLKLTTLGITCDEQAAVFYHSIVTVMQNMGYIIVAEGAETEEEVSLLREWGVDMVQGYYFSRPLPEAELLRLFML